MNKNKQKQGNHWNLTVQVSELFAYMYLEAWLSEGDLQFISINNPTVNTSHEFASASIDKKYPTAPDFRQYFNAHDRQEYKVTMTMQFLLVICGHSRRKVKR